MTEEMRGVLVPGKRKAYALAGHAIITVRSTKTDQRFTYKVSQPKSGEPFWYVGLLNGPDNTSDYRSVGVIRMPQAEFFKSRHLTDAAPSVVAFRWLSRNWESDKVEVWHEGSCGRCGRRLTVPESITSGIGPTCAGYQ